jgi:peptide/nickel transport system permease protein
MAGGRPEWAFLLNRLSQSVVLLVVVRSIGVGILNLVPGGPPGNMGSILA